jgi:opacity protein-like surface antigen
MKHACKDTIVKYGTLAVLLVSLLPLRAHGEWYIAGQAGMNFPSRLDNVKGTDLSGSITEEASDLKLEESVMYGAKLGYFFDNLKWLGLEAEAYTATPNFKAQTYTSTAIFGQTRQTRQVTLQPADLRVTTVALNLMLRAPGGRFEPYVGGGVALYWAKFSTDAVNAAGTRIGDASDTSVGMNFLAGARYYLWKRVALFGEYKYNQANFKFGGNVKLEGDYSAHNVVGGLSFHLK